MFQEPPEKLFVSQSHLPPFAAVGVVFPQEGHVGVGKINEPMIGDRDAMSVSGQVMQNMFGTTEGPLGVDHPVFSK